MDAYMVMDAYTAGHLKAWSEHKLCDDERDEVLGKMLAYLADNPELLEQGRSWSEIRVLAEDAPKSAKSDRERYQDEADVNRKRF